MKRSKAQLNAISRAYSNAKKEEWYNLTKLYPVECKELNLKYSYTEVKIKKLKALKGLN